MKVELNSRQLRFLDATGFIYIVGLFRTYRFPKDIVEIFVDGQKMRQAERYYCNRFHSYLQTIREKCG